jgi:hypothetical protein
MSLYPWYSCGTSHPFHILLVSWEFLKCPQPFYFLLLYISAHALELQATVWGINRSAHVPPPPQTLCQEPHNNYSYTPSCCHVHNILFPPFWRSFTYFCLWYSLRSQLNALCQAYSSSLELQPVMMSSASTSETPWLKQFTVVYVLDLKCCWATNKLRNNWDLQ